MAVGRPCRRFSCRCSTSTPDELDGLPALAAELKAARAAGRAARAAARGPARRAALREAVAAHAVDVPDRGARARRRRDRAAAGRRARRPRIDRRRRAQPRALGRRARWSARSRRRGSRQFADAAPRLRVVNALTDEEHPCQALADCLTLHERSAIAARPDDRLRRRRQQRRDVARAGGADARRARARRVAEGLRAAARRRARGRRARARHGATLDCSPIRGGRRGADAVYTDVWTSMGQEAEAAERRRSSRRTRSTRR